MAWKLLGYMLLEIELDDEKEIATTPKVGNGSQQGVQNANSCCLSLHILLPKDSGTFFNNILEIRDYSWTKFLSVTSDQRQRTSEETATNISTNRTLAADDVAFRW